MKNQIIQGDCLEELKKLEDNSVDSVVTDPPYGLSFMGKKWDYDVPSKELWQEVMRVLKPGGHLLSFAGSRTYHKMAVNIEDAGFEIRDQIMWVYGSGFPKSHNIGKAVNKKLGNERKVVESKRHGGGSSDIFPERNNKYDSVGNSPYEGWGTALKPAHEPIVVARKPLSEKTVAENVLKWGTGGINIDGCRVGNGREKAQKQGVESGVNQIPNRTDLKEYPADLGRFPANLIHDGSEEVVSEFPETKSVKSTKINNRYLSGNDNTKQSGDGKLMYGKISPENTHNDSGSASRFFYCAKASKSERNKGLEGFEEKQKVFNGQSSESSKDLKDVEKRFTTQPTANNHPTVKPVKLMQYLVRLITPKGGTVLDPFTGSGTTGIGAVTQGFQFIGIEREEDYVKISNARIEEYNKDLLT